MQKSRTDSFGGYAFMLTAALLLSYGCDSSTNAPPATPEPVEVKTDRKVGLSRISKDILAMRSESVSVSTGTLFTEAEDSGIDFTNQNGRTGKA